MPIYEYRCQKCGDFESMQRISDPPLKSCPTCRRKVTKLISSTSFQLKGSGWYITDYARKGGDAAKTGESAKGGEGKKKAAGEKTADAGDAGTSSKEAAADTKPKKKATGEKAAAA
jgi:putative FmdB family regulatory protein